MTISSTISLVVCDCQIHNFVWSAVEFQRRFNLKKIVLLEKNSTTFSMFFIVTDNIFWFNLSLTACSIFSNFLAWWVLPLFEGLLVSKQFFRSYLLLLLWSGYYLTISISNSNQLFPFFRSIPSPRSLRLFLSIHPVPPISHAPSFPISPRTPDTD